MNYTILEKVFLVLVGGLLSPLLSIGILIWSRRRLKEKESSESRAFLFYSALAGVLLGQYACHTAVIPDRFDTRIMNMCALGGFVILYFIECENRMWNQFTNYVQPPDNEFHVDPDSGLHRDKMESDTLALAENIGSEDMADVVFGNQDTSKDKKKRVLMLIIMYITFSIILCMDAFLLVYRSESSNHAAVVACFTVNSFSLSIAIYSAIIHAKYHTYENFKRSGIWRWSLLTTVWCALLITTTVPVLLDLSMETATSIVEHYGMLCTYGLASGVLLKLCFYYFNRGVARSDRKAIRLGVLVFALATAQSAVTGVWL